MANLCVCVLGEGILDSSIDMFGTSPGYSLEHRPMCRTSFPHYNLRYKSEHVSALKSQVGGYASHGNEHSLVSPVMS